MIERRDNGDLVLFACNGDPFVRFSTDGHHFLTVNTNGSIGGAGFDDHPLNCRAEQLDREAVEAIRDWCEASLSDHTTHTRQRIDR